MFCFLVKVKEIGGLHTWFDLEQNGVIEKYRMVRQYILKNKFKSSSLEVTVRRVDSRKDTGVYEGFGLPQTVHW